MYVYSRWNYVSISSCSATSGIRCSLGLHFRLRRAWPTTPLLTTSARRAWWGANKPCVSARLSNSCSCFLVILILTTLEESSPSSFLQLAFSLRFSKALLAFPSVHRWTLSGSTNPRSSSSTADVATRQLLQFPILLLWVCLLQPERDCNE